MDQLNQLPFRCCEPIILPFLLLKRGKIIVGVCYDAEMINSLLVQVSHGCQVSLIIIIPSEWRGFSPRNGSSFPIMFKSKEEAQLG